jgi:hypothetical protein
MSRQHHESAARAATVTDAELAAVGHGYGMLVFTGPVTGPAGPARFRRKRRKPPPVPPPPPRPKLRYRMPLDRALAGQDD